jgi:hypothetical protein
MSLTEPENGAPAARPHTLSASFIIRRAILGLVILFSGTFLSVWLYDATIKANASTQAIATEPAPGIDPITVLRQKTVDNR